MIKISATLGGMGSVAISAVPILEKTRFDFGKCLNCFLQFVLHFDSCGQAGAGDADGMEGNVLLIEAGKNSLPIRVPSSRQGPQ